MSLDNVPFLGGYLTMDQANRARENNQLAQAGQFMTLSGAMQDQQAKLAERQRAQDFRNATAALGPNASPEAVMAAARPFLGPKDLATITQGAEDKKAQREVTREATLSRLAQSWQLAQQGYQLKLQSAQTAQERTQIMRDELADKRYHDDQALQLTGKRLFYDTGMDAGIQARPQAAQPQAMPQPMAGDQGVQTTAGGQPVPAGDLATIRAAQMATQNGQPFSADVPQAAPMAPAQSPVAPVQPAVVPAPAAPNPQDIRAQLEAVRAAQAAQASAQQGVPIARGVQPPAAMQPVAPAPQVQQPMSGRGREAVRVAGAIAAAKEAASSVTQDPARLASSGAAAATGMPLSQVVPGYGKTASEERKVVRDEALRQIKAENPGMTDIQAGQEYANRTIDFAAGKRSVAQLNTMLGATKQAVSQLDFNIEKTKQTLKEIPLSTDLSPIINAIIRKEQQWTGEPKLAPLFYYMNATAMESARLLQGGQASVAQLHVGAAEEAKKWASVNMTPASFDEVAKAMHDEGLARIDTFQQAIKSQGMRKDAPQGSSIENAVRSAGYSYEPEKYEYRVGIGGQVQRKAK